MQDTLMTMKVLLPFKVFTTVREVERIVVETTAGSYGLLPRRLDATAALTPGILQFETKAGGAQYIAISGGILVKAGSEVLISVRHAIDGAPLGKLKEMVNTTLQKEEEDRKSTASTMTKLEISLIKNIQQLRKDQ